MMEAARQLSLAFGGSGGRPSGTLESRRELRERTVRRVEYTPFPRVGSDTRTRVAFTRDASSSGMGLGVDLNKESRCFLQSASGAPIASTNCPDDEIQVKLDPQARQIVAVNGPLYPIEFMVRLSLGVVID